LVFVLWLMAILSALALQLSFSSHLRVQVAADLSRGTRAFFLARAGVERAIADLIHSRDETQSLLDLRESDLHIYRNAELGEGTYTLFAGTDASGEPIYGIIDEAAKLDLNSVDSQVLSKLPGITAPLATQIVASRGEDGFAHLNDLLTLENCDILTLYGEDQNHNGLLDPNENDGDESWPPDNADDLLDRGVAAYLTIFSAARNISPEGEKRVNINSADAAALTRSLPDITQEEADSIVEHRKKNQFASIADLLDVELVEKVVQQTQTQSSDRQSEGDGGRESSNGQGGGGGGRGSSNGGGDSSQGGNRGNRGNRTRNLRTSDSNQEQKQQETQFKSTGKKAFDTAKFQKIAAYVTTKDEEVLKGLININTAPYEVLASLPGLDDALAMQIVKSREERLDAYQSVADLLDLPGFSTNTFKQACSHITVRSDIFSVRSFGVIGSGETYRSVEAVIDRTQDAATIRSWRELE
jgi:DNA uptake protein ComE-like DNA-binding protein